MLLTMGGAQLVDELLEIRLLSDVEWTQGDDFAAGCEIWVVGLCSILESLETAANDVDLCTICSECLGCLFRC